MLRHVQKQQALENKKNGRERQLQLKTSGLTEVLLELLLWRQIQSGLASYIHQQQHTRNISVYGRYSNNGHVISASGVHL